MGSTRNGLAGCVVAAMGVAGGSATAQPFEIDWFTIDGGGGTSTGGGFELSGTIGQPDAGPTLTGGGFELTGGFWVIAQASAGDRLCADQNQDGVLNGADFNAWLTNFGANSPLADVNQDGILNGADFNAWLSAFGFGEMGPTCDP